MKTILYPISKLEQLISKVTLALIISLAFLAGCTHVKPQMEMTSTQIRSLQQREFNASKPAAFSSVLSIFQDQGYIVNSAEINTGFITATSPCNSRSDWTGNISTSVTKVTAFIEEFPGKVTIRLNFLETTEIQIPSLGQTLTRDNPVHNKETYDNVFKKISDLIFTKNSPS